jgi:hypothetical protein
VAGLPSDLKPRCYRTHKGHDAIVIAAQLGLHTIGVDISTTALAGSAALKVQAGVRNVEFRVDDFFGMDGSFDLVYDYT